MFLFQFLFYGNSVIQGFHVPMCKTSCHAKNIEVHHVTEMP